MRRFEIGPVGKKKVSSPIYLGKLEDAKKTFLKAFLTWRKRSNYESGKESQGTGGG